MFYQEYISREEYDRIANDDTLGDETTFPHCNTETWHEPGVCAFCDNHYRRFGTRPGPYATPEANGWGGNMAPIVDDVKAAEEQAAFDAAMARLRDL